VRIRAAVVSQLVGGDEMFNYYQDDITSFTEAQASAAQIWQRTGLGPSDVDVALLYENFSPIVFLQLEAFGFCGPGEARDFIAEGHLGPGGSLPTNTNGGLLGEGYIHGMNLITEGVRQLRSTAANQVDGAETVLVSAGRSVLLLGQGDAS
jgi:acetyl-CoA acetyltransferase